MRTIITLKPAANGKVNVTRDHFIRVKSYPGGYELYEGAGTDGGAWLRRNGVADDSRNLFKIELLSQALIPVPLPAHRNFRAQYFELSHLPEYQVLNLPSKGGSIAFSPDGLPPRVRFVHRMRQGRVELIFRGKRNELNRLRGVLDSLEHDGLKVWPYPTASAIFTEVPEVHRDMDFEPQKAIQALDAALRLWAWFRQHQDSIMASVS